MSKAFTKESDDEGDSPVSRPASVLPPGMKNYLTARGAEGLRAEMQELERARKAVAASQEDEGEIRRKLQKLTQRMREVEEKLRLAEVVPPPARPWEQVRFGATVRVRDASGEETRYRIVGVGETDLEKDRVSWVSPMARALMNRRVGDKARIQAPGGERVLEILEIGYEAEP
jgi:transcription elongation factor GreB